MYDTNPPIRRRYCPISITVAVAAALTMLGADIAGSEVTFHAGLIVFLLAATALITVRTGVNAEVLESARQAGYDAGYQDKETLLRETQPTDLRSVI